MKLYFASGSCGLASQISLREAGREFDLVKVDFKTKTTREGDYLLVTPKGLVPALKLDDGEVLTESAVILQWIADHSPERGLLPPFGTLERYRALEWLNFVATDLHKGYATLFSPFVDADSKVAFARGNLAQRLDHVERQLSRNAYVLGAQLSVVDAYLYNILSWSPRVHVDFAERPATRAYLARLEQRPSVRASLEAEGIPLA